MLSTHCRGAALVMLAAMVVGPLFVCGPAFTQERRAQRDGLQALPEPKNLAGFARIVTSGRTSGAELQGIRESDDMVVRVAVFIGSQVADARRIVNRFVSPLPMAVKSWTGRIVGDEVLISSYTGGGPPRGAFTLLARCGRSAVCVDLMHKITPGAGKPVHPIFAEADLRWAEDVAIGCVERLKKMGYGDEQEKKAQSKTKGGKKPKGK